MYLLNNHNNIQIQVLFDKNYLEHELYHLDYLMHNNFLNLFSNFKSSPRMTREDQIENHLESIFDPTQEEYREMIREASKIRQRYKKNLYLIFKNFYLIPLNLYLIS